MHLNTLKPLDVKKRISINTTISITHTYMHAKTDHDGGDEVEGDEEDVSKVVPTGAPGLHEPCGVVTGLAPHTVEHDILPVLPRDDTRHQEQGIGEVGKVVVLVDPLHLRLVH